VWDAGREVTQLWVVPTRGKEAKVQEDQTRSRRSHIRWRHLLIPMILPVALVPAAVAETGQPSVPTQLPCFGQLPGQVPNLLPCPQGSSGTNGATAGSQQPGSNRLGSKCKIRAKRLSKRNKLHAKRPPHKHGRSKKHDKSKKHGKSKKHFKSKKHARC